jgi:DNA-binding transcriptional LysR family regulator
MSVDAVSWEWRDGLMRLLADDVLNRTHHTEEPPVSYDAPSMDLLHLEHFLAVVDEGTFTRAAERVNRTQPAISQSVRRLEEEVGAPLFARDVHEVTLTEAGRLLAESARRLLAMRDTALRQVSELRTLKAGRLRIAAHESAAVYLLPGPLRHYLQKFPDIRVGIQRSRLTEIPRQVMDREVEVGFVKDEPAFHELHWVEVHADEMFLVASPDHPVGRRGSIHLRDLGAERFVIHHGCSATTDRIMQLFEQHATRCRVVAELWSFENVKSFVREEVGLAIVPGITVRRELADGTLVRVLLPELSMPRRTLMVYRDQGYVSDSASELIKLVRSFNWDEDVQPPVRPTGETTPTAPTRPLAVRPSKVTRAGKRLH